MVEVVVMCAMVRTRLRAQDRLYVVVVEVVDVVCVSSRE